MEIIGVIVFFLNLDIGGNWCLIVSYTIVNMVKVYGFLEGYEF